MKILIVEDDFFSRKLLNTFLAPYGQIDNAVNGKEAMEAVAFALTENWHYDLICLDVRMPQMDGQDALKKIRQLEQKQGITKENSAKIIMTTALSDRENVIKAGRSFCNAYMIKPLTKQKMITQLEELGLIIKTD
ncbi:MAG: response regulator [Thermodesulfobacteriota bacterium]